MIDGISLYLCLDWDESRLPFFHKIEQLLGFANRLDLEIESPVVDVSLSEVPFIITFFLGLLDQPSGLVVKEEC